MIPCVDVGSSLDQQFDGLEVTGLCGANEIRRDSLVRFRRGGFYSLCAGRKAKGGRDFSYTISILKRGSTND